MGRRETPRAKDAGEDQAARRTFVALPLAQLLPAVTRPAFRARSPAAAALMADWAAIVGPRLADLTAPRKLSHGQLTVACSGPVAMELQHAAAALIERINTQAGTRLVQRLRFVQAPVAARLPPVPLAEMGPPEPVRGLAPGALHDALAALGARIKKGSVLF
jgi:hypothetical protein